jgi:hypothetical protein
MYLGNWGGEEQQPAKSVKGKADRCWSLLILTDVCLPNQPNISTCPSTFENNARMSPRNSTTQICANLKDHTVYLSAIQQYRHRPWPFLLSPWPFLTSPCSWPFQTSPWPFLTSPALAVYYVTLAVPNVTLLFLTSLWPYVPNV